MPHNDDFFLPRNVDYSEPCANDSSIADAGIILPFGATLSVICYLYLMWMYFVLQSPIFKRHPTTLAVYKCMLELLFIQQYLWMPSIPNKEFYTDDISEEPYQCVSSSISGYLAFLTQFSLVGSELCFFIISYDLRIAYTNPFSSYKVNMNFFFNLVMGVSTVTSFILVMLGPKVYGMSDLGLVWIQKRREHGSPNYPKAVLYYIITICVFIYSLWANFQYNIDSGKGFSKTVSNRLSIMKRSKKFTIGYVGYGSLVFLMQFISFVTQTKSPVVVNAAAYLLAFRGVWGLTVIIYSNWSEMTWELANPFHLGSHEDRMKEDIAVEKLLLQPHLNTALRAEILYFTTQGIMFAARDYQRQVNARHSGTNHNRAGHTTESEDSEFSLNESSPANIRSRDERSHSTTAATSGPLSLSNLYNRRSMQLPPRGAGANAAAACSDSSLSMQSDDDDGLDMDGAAMFNRHSVAIFERLNKEQSEAVTKEMESAFLDEATALGLTKRNKNNTQAAFGRASESAVGSSRTYNPFHTQAIGRSAQKDRMPSELGVEMKLAGATGLARPDDDYDIRDNSMADDIYRESEVADVEFGMNSQNKSLSAQQAPATVSGVGGKVASNAGLWKRIEAPPSSEMGRTMSSSSVASSTAERATEAERTSRSSIISALLMNAMHTASDAAKSFFSSSQFREFRFKDFCPKLFGKVRELSGIDNEEYAKSFEKTCKEKFSEGRSGAFMFFSSNEKCIVKTTTKSESLALHAIMPQYVKHLKENPHSLVVRFLGAHCITMYGNELYFVVMLNVFPTFPLSERYDLKGSWVNRHGFEYSRKSKRERMRREPSESSPLYQDNDLQHKISLELDVTHSLASQIRRDVLFLREMKLMDYSLLIGVRRERFKVLDSNGNVSDDVDRASTVSIMRETEMSLAHSFDAQQGSISGRVANSIVARPNATSAATSAEHRVPEDIFKRDFDGGMRARLVEGPGTYYIGIIDVLQEWNLTKQMERFLKIYFKRHDGDGLSAIEPVAYSERFWRGAVLDTFDGLEYDTEELLKWRGDEVGGAGQEDEEEEDDSHA